MYKINFRSTTFMLIAAVAIILGLIALAYTTIASGRLLQARNQPKEILEVTFSYDSQQEAFLSVASLSRKYGFIPKFHPRQAEYTLELLDGAGKVTYARPFSIPNEVEGPPPENEHDRTPHHITLSQVDFTLNAPWSASVKTIVVIDKDGTIVLSEDSTKLTPAVKSTAPPTYQSLLASDYLISGSSGTTTTALESSSTTIDLAFISQGYTAEQMPQYHQDVDRIVNQILALEPYKSRASQIMLHYVDNTTDLECPYSGRLILCNRALAAQILNSQAVPYDKALIVVNNANYGGAGDDPIATTYNGTFGPLVGAHEFAGHSIGNLSDEYALSMNEFQMVNCSTSATIPTSWRSVVAPEDYTLGCNFPNYYRSSAKSIMNVLTDTWFNVISQQAINARLDYYAGPYTNSVSPTVTMSSPVDGDIVSGPVTINADASDDQGVTRVELWKDNTLVKTQYLPPYTFTWASIQDTNATHTLQVRAYDVVDNVGVSPTITVLSDNFVDTTKPVVVLTNPSTSTSTVNPMNWFYVYVSTTDNSGFIQKTELYVNNVLTDTTTFYSTTTPSRLQWDTAPLANNKTYKVYAKAYDFAGNVGTSTTINVTLLPPPDTIAPVATLTKPTNGAVIPKTSGSTTISGSATDAKGVKKIELYRGTTIVKTCTNTSSCSTSVSNSTFSTGTSTVTIKAYDAANNVGSASVNVKK